MACCERGWGSIRLMFYVVGRLVEGLFSCELLSGMTSLIQPHKDSLNNYCLVDSFLCVSESKVLYLDIGLHADTIIS